MKKILITNDDGIDADGIVRLARTAAEFGEVWVVAPDSQRSAMSHSITLRHCVEAWKVNFPGCGLAQCKGILYDRAVSTGEFYKDRYIETKVSEDRISYMVEGIRNYDALEGTDLKAIFDNYVSVGVATNIS